jgi:hypothetical protein
MGTKASRVRAVISGYEECYRSLGKTMRNPSERVEELWFEIDDHLDAMEAAEEQKEERSVKLHIEAILALLAKIKSELSL